MRVGRGNLVEIARRETLQRVSAGNLLSGYLIGSVATGNPLLGGTADIDLVLIHEDHPPRQREIVRLSDHIHLDIAHHARELYARPRELRVHPWLGPALCAPIFLYDPQHFFEWAQAGARGQFFRPDFAYARSQAFLKNARQSKSLLALSGRWLMNYLRAALAATNAIACLEGRPAAGRRLMLTLESQLEAIGHPEINHSFQRLLGVDQFNAAHLPEWMSAWACAFDDAVLLSDETDIVSCRRMYYLRGFQSLAESGRPELGLYVLLSTWERSIHTLVLQGDCDPHLPAWEAVLHRLRLSPASEGFRSDELESYLDQIESILESWSDRAGA